jgi:selenide,water dikinase
LLKLLEGLGDGIGMDCSVRATKIPDVYLVSTTDFFYPLVTDPFLQGRIGCANVLSDLYAMGVADCDELLMLLAASLEMPETERNVVSRLMIEGFNAAAKEADVKVGGGQSVLNPWPIIGGVAMAVCHKSGFIMPNGSLPGDVLVLTKPVGTQVAVNFYQWTQPGREERWARVKDSFSTGDAERAFHTALESMGRLNRNGARLMHKYKAHGCTDVTGFGLLGHARNLAQCQTQQVSFEIHTLPIIRNMKAVDGIVKTFKLLDGLSAETSGGLLVALPADQAQQFIDELVALDKQPAWIVGRVVASEGTRDARILLNPTILEI